MKKRLTTFACLALLVMGPAAVWASAPCPSVHAMEGMRPSHDCPGATCCVAPAALSADAPGKARPQASATAPAIASSPVVSETPTLTAARAVPAAFRADTESTSRVLRL